MIGFQPPWSLLQATVGSYVLEINTCVGFFSFCPSAVLRRCEMYSENRRPGPVCDTRHVPKYVHLGVDMDITVLSSLSEPSLSSPPQALRLPPTWPHLPGSAPSTPPFSPGLLPGTGSWRL